jgi:hypothetical protein
LRDAIHAVVERRVSLSDEMILRLLRTEGPNQLGAEKLFERYAQIDRLARLADELVEDSIGWRLLRRTRQLSDALAPPDTLRGRFSLRVKKLLRRAR